jgi:16S rRNA processing protein RimM
MAQPVNNRFIEIGRIGRARGLEGQVRFMPNDVFTVALFDQDLVFYMKNFRSDLIPARVESTHVEKKKNQQTFFVKFDTIANREEADAAMNKAVYVDEEVVDIDVSPAEDETTLFGYAVIYNDEEVGEVLDVINNPAHLILEIKIGAGALLVPFVDEFIVNADHDNHTIICRNLDQLTDL